MACGTIVASGLSQCKRYLQRPKAGVIHTKGTTYTAAELATIAKLKTLLSASSGIQSLYLPFNDYERTTDAPDIQTTPLNFKNIYDDKIPSGIAYLNIGYEDYKTLWDMNNTEVDIELFTNDGKRILTRTSDGKFRALTVGIYCVIDLADFGDYQKSAPVYLFYRDLQQFKNIVVLDTNYTTSEIEALAPAGLDIQQHGAVSSGDVTVMVTTRGNSIGKTGLTTWTVVSSNVSNAAITPTEVANGEYSLALKKNSPAEDIVSGDYIEVQGSIVSTGYILSITQPIKIYA